MTKGEGMIPIGISPYAKSDPFLIPPGHRGEIWVTPLVFPSYCCVGGKIPIWGFPARTAAKPGISPVLPLPPTGVDDERRFRKYGEE